MTNVYYLEWSEKGELKQSIIYERSADGHVCEHIEEHGDVNTSYNDCWDILSTIDSLNMCIHLGTL